MGRVPEERHTHYDADGNMTGWTVVEREPYWLPSDYSGIEALREYRSQTCSRGHHEFYRQHEADLHLTFAQKTCWICKAIDQHDRGQQAADERFEKGLGEKPSPIAPRPADGRETFIRFKPPEGEDDRGGEPPSPHAGRR